MKCFADRLAHQIESSKSVLVAGIDPRLDDLPDFFLDSAGISPTASGMSRGSDSFDSHVAAVLTSYLERILPLVAGKVAAVKPNLAFFEQYGLGGLTAFVFLMRRARELGVLTIADAKRGDIGSTAQAYSTAFLGRARAWGKTHAIFDADALTVNPFLGFDTVREYVKDCVEYGKGIFVLTRTSNPGAPDLQGTWHAPSDAQQLGPTITEKVAHFIAKEGEVLRGECGLSGLGAVVGATYPHEAERLRELMPQAIFLIPGYGAQGGSALDAMAGFTKESPRRGGLVNSSRGIFSIPNARNISPSDFDNEILTRLAHANRELNAARS